ncbi:F-box domain protein [Metarhizium album ARSEF 1941]|uniref:F-box domain protein n=1 Tax=Metarhizium album (strain ARSEF 1941) TaxID=1081103 RepID=A0A0B2WW41_METAS|nr:F-box domain protein [Metarhizium album ARSEF 1941]KHN97809.1 F-box domain protein [Metarhizium album ARSEF 1941]
MTKKFACLAALPVEILLDIYQHLDLRSILELSLTNSEFLIFFQRRKVDILLPVLMRDFSPFDEFVQVYTASAGDITRGGLYKPRKVALRRFAGDEGLVLSNGISFSSLAGDPVDGSFTHVTHSRPTPKVSGSSPDTVFLTTLDLDGLLNQCRVVREWQELFPQMRWFHQPEDCRFLRPHEQLRFRRALYRWWLYGIYFHGDFPRPRVGHPEPFVDDIRTSQMRYHSTAELVELMDFLETIKDMILQYICPRLDPSQQQAFIQTPLVEDVGRSQSLATSWNDQSHWGRIVKTYAKLGPEDLLYYFNNIYSYPRKRLITEIQLRHPNFTSDQESIQIAIRCALDERSWLDKMVNLAEHDAGGIIDFDDERDEDRLRLQGDASPTGQLPEGSRLIQSYSRYSPRGDDGAFLDDYLRLSAESRLTASATPLGAVN